MDVTEETNLINAVLLADLTSQVMRSSKARVQLNINITQPAYRNTAFTPQQTVLVAPENSG